MTKSSGPNHFIHIIQTAIQTKRTPNNLSIKCAGSARAWPRGLCRSPAARCTCSCRAEGTCSESSLIEKGQLWRNKQTEGTKREPWKLSTKKKEMSQTEYFRRRKPCQTRQNDKTQQNKVTHLYVWAHWDSDHSLRTSWAPRWWSAAAWDARCARRGGCGPSVTRTDSSRSRIGICVKRN